MRFQYAPLARNTPCPKRCAVVRTRPEITCRFWRGEDKTGKEDEAGVLIYTSMQPDAVPSPPRAAINR